MAQRLLCGWGRTAATLADVVAPADSGEVAAIVEREHPRGLIARGLGRSYGDAAQNAGGDVLATSGLRRILAIDRSRGMVTAESGVSVEQLLARLVPLGWFLPVVPGTRHVTLGGAIASDVHGKNHHRDGALGRHVRSMELLAPRRGRVALTLGATPDEHWATAGGMGLTGVLTAATVALIPIETSWIAAELERADDLDQAMARMAARDGAHRYSVAWIDCLAGGRHLGRAVQLWGDHATIDQLPIRRRSDPLRRPPRPSVAAPPWAPAALLRRETVAAFNELYFRRAPRRAHRIVPVDRFFFPLDAVRAWNRLYGRRGLLQYQLVVPFGRDDVLRAVLERLRGARTAPFLAVLKRFGAAQGPLSFPMPGWSLAVDLAAGSPDLAAVLDALDDLVAQAGGRVYLAKDSRLRPDLLEAMYPGLHRWREVRAGLDPERVMRSDLARRVGLLDGAA